MFSLFAALILQLRNALADRSDLLLENAALRQQLTVYQRQGNRPALTSADRLFWVWLSRSWRRWRSALFIVQQETVIRWHRDAWKRYWTWKGRRSSRRRPRIAPVGAENSVAGR
jgi:putative transposase